MPAMDAVEARYPTHVCVLFRAIAHQQARRRGLIRDVEEDEVGRGVAGGFFPRLWLFRTADAAGRRSNRPTRNPTSGPPATTRT